jgi:putative CocE/NonD family hydrolase
MPSLSLSSPFSLPCLPVSRLLPLLLLPILALSGTASQAALCRNPSAAESAIYTSPVNFPGIISPIDGTCFLPAVTITSFDGVKLAGNVFLPKSTGNSTQKFPAIVMVASWAAPGRVEYLGQQYRLAKDGYIVASYTARGFYLSEGTINVASSADVRDVSAALDWVAANTPVDLQNVAASGISYGAGLSLMALAADSRFKTAAAFSGWANLVDQLYSGNSANVTWSNVLNLAGAVTGRRDPVVEQNINTLNNPNASQSDIAAITAWAAPRSPSSYVNALNARRAPVFISKNFQDDMFTPNSSMALFSALAGPKLMHLSMGIHGSAELPGALFGIDNYPYDDAHRWFNYWLKGEQNGIQNEPSFSMQVKFTNRREFFNGWPAANVKNQNYYLSPRGEIRFDWNCLCGKGDKGGLSAAPNGFAAADTINNSADTTATSGLIPILSTAGEAVNLPVLNSLLTVTLANGVRYEGNSLAAPLKIRGIPKLKLRATPSQARSQVVAYLYDVDLLGNAVLITHGARSEHWAVPNQTIDYPIEFSATAYDVPAGHHLGIVLDTADSLVGAPVNPGERFSVRFEFDPARQASFILPTL